MTTEDLGETTQAGTTQTRFEDIFDRARRHHVTILQHHDAGREPRDLLDGMRDVHDGDMQVVAERFDQGQDLKLALAIERGERFVHEQNFGRCQECAAHGHSLLLATR